ncbi:acyl-CoA dehydrogenase family protein [Xanthobacter wiegelii]|uniref:acyl-CoA dehydrogenase family protein n=1 Tax=Xanthobacter wiegelii TaxID=3119913 RepID=UPI003728C791
MLHTQTHAPCAEAPAADDFAAILVEQTDRLLTREVTAACLREADAGAFPAAAWQAVCDAGLPHALEPEEDGGVGLDVPAAARILRRAGFHALPAPLGEDMMARALWSAAGGAPVDGLVTFAGGLWPAARLCAAPLPAVPWAGVAAHVLVALSDDAGERLILLPRDAYAVETRRNLAGEPRDALSIAGEDLGRYPSRPWSSAAGADGLSAYGAFVRAQQMAGAMERCLGLAVAYANERKQFGKPIGRFQAVQHMLAVAAGESAAAAAAAEVAAAAFGTSHFAVAVAVAKARCGEAAGKVAEICHQVHGAMGFTREHTLHVFTRRLWAWRDEFGNETLWQQRIGRAVCAEGGEALWPRLVALRTAGGFA